MQGSERRHFELQPYFFLLINILPFHQRKSTDGCEMLRQGEDAVLC